MSRYHLMLTLACLTLLAACSGGGASSSNTPSGPDESQLPVHLRTAPSSAPIGMAADNLSAGTAAFEGNSAVVVLLNRKPHDGDPQLTLSMQDSAGTSISGSQYVQGRHLYFVPEQPLPAGQTFTVNLQPMSASWTVTTSAAKAGDWQPATDGLKRPLDTQQLVSWHGRTYALCSGKSQGLFVWDQAASVWQKLVSTSASSMVYSNDYLVLMDHSKATPISPDGTIGDPIEIGWQAPYDGFRTCMYQRRLFIYNGGENVVVSVDLTNQERKQTSKVPMNNVDGLVVDSAGSLMINYKWSTSGWWKSNDYSAKEKVDGGNWDPEANRWRYEQAVYRLEGDTWVDVTANLQCGNMTDGISPGPVGEIVADVDSDPVIMSTEQGLWQWQPETSDWKAVVDYYGQSAFTVNNDTVVALNHGTIDVWQPGFIAAFQIPAPRSRTCNPIITDDHQIFVGFEQNVSLLGDGFEHVTIEQGPYRYQITADTPRRSYNLDVDFAGIIGEQAGNQIVAAEVVGDGLVAVVGIFAGTPEVRYYNSVGQQQGAALTLPSAPTDADEDAGELAIATTQGPIIIAADRSTMTTLAEPHTVGADGCRIDFDAGTLVWLGNKTLRLYDRQLTLKFEKHLDHSFVTDAAIDSVRQQVIAVGFDNRNNTLPVQIPVARAFTWASGELVEQWNLWYYSPNELKDNMADSRLYHVLYAANGSAYVAGETAGGNTVFRWNGEDLTTPALVKAGPYTDLWQTRSEHKLYYARLDPDAGKLLYGQMCFPRLSNFQGNTMKSQGGDLEVTANGTLFFATACGAFMEGRDLNRINGQLVGGYAGGDLTLLMVSPDFKNRYRWTCFNGANSSGGGTALAITDQYAVLGGNISKGSMIVTDGSTPLSPEADEQYDAYLVIWDPAQDQQQASPIGISRR